MVEDISISTKMGQKQCVQCSKSFQEQQMFVIEFGIITITDIPHGNLKEKSVLIRVKSISFICKDGVKHLC